MLDLFGPVLQTHDLGEQQMHFNILRCGCFPENFSHRLDKVIWVTETDPLSALQDTSLLCLAIADGAILQDHSSVKDDKFSGIENEEREEIYDLDRRTR